MIRVTESIVINESEIQLDFIRSSGPGGQNVNKVATAVHLCFDAAGCASLSDDIRKQLRKIAGRQMTSDGKIMIKARRFRSQERNRQDALNRLVELIRAATQKSKPRRKTKPTVASEQRRLAAKRQRSQIKQLRRSVDDP